MTGLGVFVEGDRQVALRFDKFPAALHDKLLEAIRSLTTELATKIRAAEPRKSGKLQSDTEASVYDDAGRKISGRVFVSGDYAKAGALEYGAHGRAKVRAHSMKLDHVFSNRLNAPLTVAVAAHSRQMNISARRFLRSPLAEFSPNIEAILSEVVNQAIQETDQ